MAHLYNKWKSMSRFSSGSLRDGGPGSGTGLSSSSNMGSNNLTLAAPQNSADDLSKPDLIKVN